MADERRIVVVADTSGSMREHGKAMVARNLLDHARQTWSGVTGASPILVQWGADVNVLRARVETELPPLLPDGRAAIEPLIALLEELASEPGPIGVILLSDGHLSAADVNAFRAWSRRRPNVAVRSIAIGPDAATATLARLASASEPADRHRADGAELGARGWFGPQDICAALGAWPSVNTVPMPTCIAELTNPMEGP